MTTKRSAVCGWCGETFAVTAKRGLLPSYCGRSHRQRAYEARLGARAQAERAQSEAALDRLADAAQARAGTTHDVDDPLLAVARDVLATAGRPLPRFPPPAQRPGPGCNGGRRRSAKPFKVVVHPVGAGPGDTGARLFTAHTTPGAAATSARQLAETWTKRQGPTEAARWAWTVVDDPTGAVAGEPLTKPEAQAEASRLIVRVGDAETMYVRYPDPTFSHILRLYRVEGGHREPVALRWNKHVDGYRVDLRGEVPWDQHPYAGELIGDAAELAYVYPSPAHDLYRHSVDFATEVLVPLGDRWELAGTTISVIDPSEASQLEASTVHEGMILVVPPTGHGPIRCHRDATEFAAKEGCGVHTLCVTGVGSSALGSAAFARNVADGTGRAAAAVVSGYGTADLISEALGGWFLFQTVNRLRHQFELVEGLLPTARHNNRNFDIVRRAVKVPFTSEDTVAALALLLHRDLTFNLLVGHSKGNLVLAEALSGLVDGELPRESEVDGEPQLAIDKIGRIVTISAAIYMPAVFDEEQIVDVMGERDVLGWLNSSPAVRIDRPIPGAGHHTNTTIDGHLPVQRVMEKLMAEIDFAGAVGAVGG